MFPVPMMPTPMDATLIRSLAAFRPILGSIKGATSSPAPCLRMVRRPMRIDLLRRGAVRIRPRNADFSLSASQHVAELLQIPLADFRGLARRVRHVPGAVELVHDIGLRIRLLHRLENRFQIDHADTEWGIAAH